MNILVYPHELVMGGSQINAIELAAAVRDRGHRVTVTAPDGVLVSLIKELGLDYVPIPTPSFYPSMRTAWHLARLARRLHIDLIHAYEWRPSLEAAFGPHFLDRMPMLMTVLSMRVSASLPRHIPLIVGTRELIDETCSDREVWLMEPPIDAVKNRTSDTARARARWGFRDNEVVISVVCRLTHEHEKLEGVLEAIAVANELADHWPIRMLIVGSGEGAEQVEQSAAAVNRRCGREVVIAAGLMLDPRDAYEASDIIFGMGSSALKAMAFSKPLVVQGTQGFWRVLDAGSLEMFLHQGWFGHGGGGPRDLNAILQRLIRDPDMRLELGRLGRGLIEERFSLDRAADRLIEIYGHTVASQSSIKGRLPSMIRSTVEEAKFRTVMALRASRRMLSRHGR